MRRPYKCMIGVSGWCRFAIVSTARHLGRVPSKSHVVIVIYWCWRSPFGFCLYFSSVNRIFLNAGHSIFIFMFNHLREGILFHFIGSGNPYQLSLDSDQFSWNTTIIKSEGPSAGHRQKGETYQRQIKSATSATKLYSIYVYYSYNMNKTQV